MADEKQDDAASPVEPADTGADSGRDATSAAGTSGEADTASGAPRRPSPDRPRPTPGGRAATRARRIGGRRPMPGPVTEDDDTGSTGAAVTGASAKAAVAAASTTDPETKSAAKPAAKSATKSPATSATKSPATSATKATTASSAAATEADGDAGTAPRRTGRSARAVGRAATKTPAKAASTGKPGASGGRTGAKGTAATAGGKGRNATGRSAPTTTLTLPGWARWAPAAVLGAAAIALAVLVGFFSHTVWWGKPDVYADRGAVLSAAKSCSATIFSYDYRHLAQDKAQAAPCVYGKFATQYTSSINKIISPNAGQNKSVQTTSVQYAGVVSADDRGQQWTVVVLAQSKIVNSNTSKQGRLDLIQYLLTMEKHGGKWVIVNARQPAASGLG